MAFFKRIAACGLASGLVLVAGPAQACLSCGCGGSGASSDLSAVGGISSLFSQGQHWLVQQGVSMRDINGSFNERGEWNPVPVGGSLRSMQSTLGVTYFPSLQSSIGIQLPLIANRLDQAQWGPLGSVAPTDLGTTTGAALGDVIVQGSYELLEIGQFGLGAWGGATVPTGVSAGDAAGLTGGGVYSAQAGLVGLTQLGNFELAGSVGYQRPFNRPSVAVSTFYIGEAFLGQLQSSYRLSDAWRLGLAVNGYLGNGHFNDVSPTVAMGKLKVVPSVQYAWAGDRGLRLAVGYDPRLGGTSAMTDLSTYAVFYQYLQ
jgi:hypothetical protein